MNRRIQVAFFLALLMVAFSCTVAHAQSPTPTATWTPRPTQTATPTSAVTRTPFPTPTETPVPLSDRISQANADALPIGFLGDWSTVTASLDKVGNYADTTLSNTTTLKSSDAPFELSMTDPFSMARGLVTVLADFDWVAMLFGWFSLVFLLIIVIEAIRLIVSLWGIIQRIIDVIKLLPFL